MKEQGCFVYEEKFPLSKEKYTKKQLK